MKGPTFELFKQHGAEAAREFGILWLVFALLDKVVAGAITLPWMIWNFLLSVAMWTAGMYIEMKRR
jgi:hypothetical protein